MVTLGPLGRASDSPIKTQMHCSKCMSNNSLSVRCGTNPSFFFFARLKCQTIKKKRREKKGPQKVCVLRPRATELSAKPANVSFTGKIMKEREDKSSGGGENPGGANLEARGGRWISFHLRSGGKHRSGGTHSPPLPFLRLTKVCPDFITELYFERATAFVGGSTRAAEDRDARTPLELQRQTAPGGAPKPRTAADGTHGLDVASFSVPSAGPAAPSSPPA